MNATMNALNRSIGTQALPPYPTSKGIWDNKNTGIRWIWIDGSPTYFTPLHAGNTFDKIPKYADLSTEALANRKNLNIGGVTVACVVYDPAIHPDPTGVVPVVKEPEPEFTIEDTVPEFTVEEDDGKPSILSLDGEAPDEEDGDDDEEPKLETPAVVTTPTIAALNTTNVSTVVSTTPVMTTTPLASIAGLTNRALNALKAVNVTTLEELKQFGLEATVKALSFKAHSQKDLTGMTSLLAMCPSLGWTMDEAKRIASAGQPVTVATTPAPTTQETVTVAVSDLGLGQLFQAGPSESPTTFMVREHISAGKVKVQVGTNPAFVEFTPKINVIPALRSVATDSVVRTRAGELLQVASCSLNEAGLVMVKAQNLATARMVTLPLYGLDLFDEKGNPFSNPHIPVKTQEISISVEAPQEISVEVQPEIPISVEKKPEVPVEPKIETIVPVVVSKANWLCPADSFVVVYGHISMKDNSQIPHMTIDYVNSMVRDEYTKRTGGIIDLINGNGIFTEARKSAVSVVGSGKLNGNVIFVSRGPSSDPVFNAVVAELRNSAFCIIGWE